MVGVSGVPAEPCIYQDSSICPLVLEEKSWFCQNAAGGTYSLQRLPAFRAVTATATFCVLSHFVYTLHLLRCATAVTGRVRWTEAIGFMAVSAAKYWWANLWLPGFSGVALKIEVT